MAHNSENLPRPGDTDNKLLQKIANLLANGIDIEGGTINIPGNINAAIADGANVAQGSTTDLAVASPLSDPATSISLQRNEISLLGSIATQLATKASQTTLAQIQTANGAITDAAVTNPASNASIVAALKGILTDVNKIPTSPSTDRTTAAAPFSVELSDGAAFYTGVKTGQLPSALGATTAAGSTSVAIATDQLTTLQNVGGYTAGLKDTTAVSTSAYTAGDAVGGKRTITGALRTSNGSGILESITILDRANQKAAMELFIFDSDPTAATITDNAAFVFSTDDLKVLAHVTIAATDYITINSKAIATIKGLGIALRGANSNTSLYAALVTTGTPTYVATTDLQLIYGILQD